MLRLVCADWWRALLNLIFPNYRCFSCGQEGGLDGTGLCSQCWSRLEEMENKYPPCAHCASFVFETGSCCINCRQKKEYWFDGARAVFPYEGAMRDIIHQFKYHGVTKWAVPLGLLMLRTIERDARFHDVEVLAPVPLHIKRERSRGYNQSELLAREIGTGLKLPVVPDLLRRIVDTPSQTGLNRKARQENLGAAFVVKDVKAVTGKNILLVDDIYTTGATIETCSRILKIEGAKSVWVVTCAAGKSY
ncbi:ComF family protein [Candidatus Formimonas warabiya]|uniref:ComF family protein n=1 Tax=Formimonas warabiya TaxID=1761012 RepID=A0A3G1KUR6_FORW1|nr:ComF family protein [Candidatus Formimonas warabiya]ATW25935.1 hypothetical protein DCMF_15170 [Candidatus Formimonas warabiya]